MTYHQRENQRRFVVYVKGKPHCETVDHAHAMHVADLLKSDGQSGIHVGCLTANQITREIPYGQC